MSSVLSIEDFDKRRRSLEHTWLKNRLLRHLRAEQETWSAGPRDAALPAVLAAAPERARDARELLALLDVVFGPGRRIEEGPLSELPPDIRAVIAEALTRRYLERIDPLRSALESAIDEFEVAASDVGRIWNESGDGPIRTILTRLEHAAEALRKALLELPENPVLP